MIKKQYIASALALVLVATWLIYQRTSKASIERDNIAREASMNRDNLERESKLRSSSNSSDASRANASIKSAQVASSDAPDTSNTSIDTTRNWKYLVGIFCAEGKYRGEAHMAAWNRLKTLLAEMSEDELMAAYPEIAGLPSTTPGRSYVANEILANLELKNPAYAFGQYIAIFEKDERNTIGLGRFHLWLARDPAAATAWYESEVAKGTFDKTLGNNDRLRLPFEAGFIRNLLTSDPAAAESRINQIPPEQRASFVRSYMEASESDPKALVDLIRKTVSKEQQAELIVSKAIDLGFRYDPAKVLETFERIQATPEERSALLQMEALKDATLKNFTSTHMQRYRDWALAIEPSTADRSTGLAFSRYAEKYKGPQNHEYLTKLANDYHDMGAGDDFIISLVEGSGTTRTPLPLENARALAMKISDQTRRNEILEKLQ